MIYLDLGSKIPLITGIDKRVIEDAKHLPDISIARRMPCASRRNTTRIEDEV
jgi:hypothetical protein